MPPQTQKKPTGPYDRQHLLDHLKKEAKVREGGLKEKLMTMECVCVLIVPNCGRILLLPSLCV